MVRPSEYYPNLSTRKLTLPILTKYEKVKVLAFRASQICQNSPIYTSIEPEDLKKMTALDIAEKELESRSIPFKIRRYFPDKSYEDWSLEELQY
jgi:DNA-directed RNA polymerases I, II, and III subunit RPABC2